MTVEKKVSDAILQTKEDITIGGKTYKIGKPTVATVIMCSELISRMPAVGQVSADKIVFEVLHTAKDMKVLGQICAVLILGAKKVKEIREDAQKRTHKRLFSFLRKTDKPNEFDALSEEILDNASSKEMSELISKRLVDLDIGDFFGVTTSLAEANLLRPTKREVDD